MGKKSGPAPPDYTAMAEKSAESNKQAVTAQTWANRPDQRDPWGNVSWSNRQEIDPATGQSVTKWSQNTQLDPRLQSALDAQIATQQGRSDIAQSMIERSKGEFGQAMDWSRFNPMSQGAQAQGVDPTTGAAFDPTARSGQAANAAYAQATSRLDPQWEKRQRDLETQLANQGISRNSEAYSRAMADMTQGRSDAYNQAQWTAQQAGAAEAQRMQQMGLGQQQQAFGQSLQAGAQNFNQQQAMADYANKLRQGQINEAMQQRAFSLNEMNALLSGQQVNAPQFGSFNTSGNWGGTDYSGAAKDQYQAAMDKQSASNAATGQAIGGIASMAMMFSDRATKRVLRRMGRHKRGFGIYEFRYIGERGTRVGVVAQEVQRYAPELVSSRRGVLMVDYSKL